MTGEKYATTTTVSVERSRGEIETILTKYGATSFAYGTEPGRAMIAFAAAGRRIQFTLEIPDQGERRFTHRIDARSGAARPRVPEAAYKEWEQACRSRWRGLALLIRATLEAVEIGIIPFDTAFLPYTVLPGGRTVADEVRATVDEAYATGIMPASLLAIGTGQ